MKGKTTWYRKLSAGLTAVLALAITLALMLGMIPMTAVKTQADEIPSVTATSTDLKAPEIGELVKEPTFDVASDPAITVVTDWWRQDGKDMWEGEAITPGVWTLTVIARLEKSLSTNTFANSLTLTINGELWTSDNKFEEDTEYYYAYFHKDYNVPESPIKVSPVPEIPENVLNTIIYAEFADGSITGGTAPYTYSKISGPEWINVDPSTGEITGTPDALGYNDTLDILITDSNNVKAVVSIAVGPTKRDLREAVYEITAKGKSPSDLLSVNDPLVPISLSDFNPDYVNTDTSRDYWEKYNEESNTWEKQTFGTTITGGRYRYQTYLYADRKYYSFAHPYFDLLIGDDEWDDPWTLDHYDSSDTWAYYRSSEFVATEKIKKITITGVQYPMNNIGSTTYGITVKEPGMIVNNERWYNQTDSAFLNDSDLYVSGKAYLITMSIYTTEGFEFADSENLEVSINGITSPITVQRVDDYELYLECPIPLVEQSDDSFVVIAGALNVRASASINSDRIGGLKYGDYLKAQAEYNGWVNFNFKDSEGIEHDAWVDRKYLALTSSEEAANALKELKGGPTKYTITAGALNVRADKSTSSTRIGGYKEGDEILATGLEKDTSNEEWLVVDYPATEGRRVGYVMKKYADTDDPSVEPVSTEEPAKEDNETPELHWTGGVPAHVSFAYKSAVAYDNNVTITDDNYQDNGDGTYNVVIYPDDAMNFTTLQITDIQLSNELTAADFIVQSLVLNADGSISVKLGEAEISYTFSKGSDGSWTKGSNETFDLTVNRNINDDKTFSLFDSIEVDGSVIAASNYTASSGSLNASIKASYLETLAAGTHTLKVNFEDGSAETKLTINEAASGAAQTGDMNNIALFAGLMAAALLIVLGLFGFRKNKQ